MSLQIQSEEAFLKFVAGINLGEFENTVIEVAGQVTGSFSDTSIDPAKKDAKPTKHTLQ